MKVETIWSESRKLLGEGQISVHSLSGLILQNERGQSSHPTSTSVLQILQMDLSEALRKLGQDYYTHLHLSKDSKEELVRWDTKMVLWNGRNILTMDLELIIEPLVGERHATGLQHGWALVGTRRKLSLLIA